MELTENSNFCLIDFGKLPGIRVPFSVLNGSKNGEL
jgi:hypothetical protein